MGVGSAIQAGEAFVKYVLDDSKLDGQLGKIGQKLNSIGNVGLVAGGALASIFLGATVTFANVGNELEKLSTKTGLSVENLSELKFAAQQSDVELSVLTKAFKNLQANGIDPARFDEIAAEIRSLPDPTARAQAAIEIFGSKTGQALLPLIDELPQLRQKSRDLALTMSGENAVAAEKLHDAMAAGEAQIVALGVAIGGAIAGPLTDFLNWSEGVVANIINWIHANPGLISGIATATGVLLGMAVAFKAIAVAAAIAQAFTNPVAFAASAALAVGAGAIVGYAASTGASAIASPASAASASSAAPGHESASDIVDRLDRLINLARNSGTVAGVG